MLKEQDVIRTRSGEKPQEYPTLYIDETGKRIKINDKIISFLKDGYRWRVLLLLASSPHIDIQYTRIRDVEEQFGSKAKTTSLRSIPDLRQMMEENPKEPKIIIRSKTHSSGRETAYRLEADVKFMEDSYPDKKKTFPVEEELFLDERQIKAAYAFFALNEEGTDFKYASKAKIRKKVFEDKFLDIPDLGEGREINRPEMIRWGCDSEFDRIRKKITETLRKLEQIPLDKMHPETAVFINWLRAQPVYENLSIEDLILVVERKMSFKKLIR